MSGKTHQTREVILASDGGTEVEERPIVTETPLTIVFNGRELITLLTTGDAQRELALGFLLSEGFIRDGADLLDMSVDEEAGRAEVRVAESEELKLREKLWGKRVVTSGCGKGATFTHVLDSLEARPLPPGPVVAPSVILALMAELHRMSDLYRRTRGVHNCALAERDKILLFRDDIGRHNAVDKIHGACFMEGIPLGDKLLLTTGRLTSEIVVKTARMGVPILVSRSAPTTLAMDLAGRVNMTLVGYVRAGKMTVYTGKERIETERVPGLG